MPRGRIPRPAKLRLAEGAKPSEVNQAEPIAPDEELWPPPLPDDVQDVWTYSVRQIDHMRLKSSADRDALVAYCVAVVNNRRAMYDLEDNGITIPGSLPGTVVTNPAWRVFRDSSNVIRAFAQEFGLTPSGRTRIKVEGGDDDSRNPYAQTG